MTGPITPEKLRDWADDREIVWPGDLRTDLLADADEIQRLEGWRPIETAPKDQRWTLLLFGLFGNNEEPRVSAGFWGDEGDWWDSEAASRSLTSFGDTPTHWMPFYLPAKGAEP